MTTTSSPAPAERRRTRGRRGRKLLWIGVGLLVFLLALVALGPKIAGPIARPIVESAVNDQIKGHAEVRSLGLSWLGAQRVSLTLDDPDGGQVADVTVRADRGLLALALGSRKLGVVYVGGKADIVRDASGETNLQRAIEPRFPTPEAPTQAPSEPAKLPRSLAGSVVLDGLEVTYSDAAIAAQTGGAIGAIRLGALRGSLDFAVGAPVTITVMGPIASGPRADTLSESGAIDLAATIRNLTDASGALTPDALAAEAALTLAAPALDAVVHASFADGVVVRTGETRITVNSAEIAALVPKVAEALAAQPDVRIAQLPSVTISIDDLRFPLGADLRTASFMLGIATTETAGTMQLPGAQAGAPSRFRIEPLRVAVAAPSLDETVTITGGTRASIDGDSAGRLAIDLSAGGLLDGNGAIRAGMPERVTGSLKVDGFSTPILQPFLSAINTTLPEGQRFNLPRDVGPTVDVSLDAATRAGSGEGGTYDIDLALQAERATVSAAVAIDGQVVSARAGGVEASFTSLAPIIDRFSAPYGVRLERGGGLSLSAKEFSVDLSALGGGSPDLRGVRGQLALAVTDTAGKVQLAGDDTLRDFRLERLALGLATPDLAGEVRVTADGAAHLAGKPLASVRSDITLANLLGAEGAPRTDALPTLRGEARVDALDLETLDTVFGSLYADTGVVLAKEVGPRADILLLAASNPSAGPNATNMDLTFRSTNLDVTAPLAVAPDRLVSREPIMIMDRAAGATLGRLLKGKAPVAFQPTGALRVALADVDVPVGPGYKIRPDRVRAGITATLTDFAVDVDLAEPGAKPRPAPQRIAMPRLVASVGAAPGAAPTVSLEGQFVHDEQPFTLSLAAALHDLFLPEPTDPADPFSVVTTASLRPETTLKITGMPASLARVVPPAAASIGDKRLDPVLLVRDTAGRTLDIEFTTAPAADRPRLTRGTLTVASEGLQTTAACSLEPSLYLGLTQFSSSVRVTPRVASHLAEVLAPDAPVTPALQAPATLKLVLRGHHTIRLKDGFALDLANWKDELKVRATIDAALAPITLPAQEGSEPLTIPAVAVRALTVDLAAPMTVLGEQGGDAQVTLAGALLQADGSGLAKLAGQAKAALKNGKPAGAMPVSLALTEVAGQWIDALLGQPALVAGALGDRFNITLSADPDRLKRRDPSEAAVTLAIDAPRLKTDTPIGLAFNKEAMFVKEAFTATWTIGPAWGNYYILGHRAGGPKPGLTLTEPTQAQVRVQRLAVAALEGVGPLTPGRFKLDTTASLPRPTATLSDGRTVRFGDVSFRLGNGPTPDQLGFSLKVPRLQIGEEPEVKPQKDQITGTIASFVDGAGKPTPDSAVLNVSGGLAPIPTDVIDAFARQNGLLTAALGPTLDLGLDAKNFSKQGGTLRLTAKSPNANADIKGRVENGLFIIDPSSPVEVSRITQELTSRFVQKALPVVATLEKTGQDEPARVIFETPVALPIDGNLDRLNGRITFDIGTARFATGDLFQRVLQVAQQRDAGQVGRRMPPLKLVMADGLVSYEPFALPFGEFKIESQGFINLSSKARKIGEGGAALPPGELEVLTFIPAGAFAAEAVPGVANLAQIGRLPIRTSGAIASPKNGIATDLVGQNALQQLIQPDKLLERLRGGG